MPLSSAASEAALASADWVAVASVTCDRSFVASFMAGLARSSTIFTRFCTSERPSRMEVT